MPKKQTSTEFIQKARLVHGDSYDYTRVEYINNSTPVTIVCREHGEFSQTPSNHVSRKSRCPSCAKKAKSVTMKHDTTSFIQKARLVHGDVYDYTRVEYVNNSTPVTIVCKTHGEFSQTPNAHTDGCKSGCPACGRQKSDISRRLTQEQFVRRAVEIHGDRYDYSKTVYIDNSTPVTIVCKIHGDFRTVAYSHIKRGRSSGCPQCGNLGISNKALAWLKEIATTTGADIQHALNGGEFTIPGTRYKADGFCRATNTVYEFYGDKWHGNLRVYKPDDKCHPFSNISADKLHKRTIERENTIKSLGYNVVSIWECDYDAALNKTIFK